MNRFDALKQFKELLDEGIITQEEFNIKKKELLDMPLNLDDNTQKNKQLQNNTNNTGSINTKNEASLKLPQTGSLEAFKRTITSIKEDYTNIGKKGLNKGIKEMSPDTQFITIVLFCCLIIFIICFPWTSSYDSSDSDSYYSSGSSSSSYGSGLSESSIEIFTKSAIIDEIEDKQSSRDWNSKIDPYSCWFNINKYYKEDDDSIVVYGTVHLKDKYGNYIEKYMDGSGGSSLDFEVKLTASGRVESCTLQ